MANPRRAREADLDEPRLGGAFHFKAYPLNDPAGLPVGSVNVLRNITLEKSLQAQWIQSEKMAATGRLAASLAHEINNPQTSCLTGDGVEDLFRMLAEAAALRRQKERQTAES